VKLAKKASWASVEGRDAVQANRITRVHSYFEKLCIRGLGIVLFRIPWAPGLGQERVDP